MHCPSCGQQQVSKEIKFCSRCGFPLGLIAEILAHGGFLPQLADLPKKRKWLTRQNGLKFSVIWFILFIIFTVLAAIGGDGEATAVFAVMGFLGALLWIVSSFLFLPKETFQGEVLHQQHPAQFGGVQNQGALPPQSYQPVDSYMPPAGSWRAPTTGNLVQPGSVTDPTTKLLKKDE